MARGGAARCAAGLSVIGPREAGISRGPRLSVTLVITDSLPAEPLSHGVRRHDLPAEHHVVVLVGQVVAVGHVRAGEGPELPRDDDLLARVERDHVLLARVVGVAAARGASGGARGALGVTRDDPVLLHVAVERGDPP